MAFRRRVGERVFLVRGSGGVDAELLLLGTGIILGPTVLGIVHPASLGSALPLIVGFAVAVILFEGGMNLRLKRIHREGRTIRQLITTGALVTAIGGTLTAKIILRML